MSAHLAFPHSGDLFCLRATADQQLSCEFTNNYGNVRIVNKTILPYSSYSGQPSRIVRSVHEFRLSMILQKATTTIDTRRMLIMQQIQSKHHQLFVVIDIFDAIDEVYMTGVTTPMSAMMDLVPCEPRILFWKRKAAIMAIMEIIFLPTMRNVLFLKRLRERKSDRDSKKSSCICWMLRSVRHEPQLSSSGSVLEYIVGVKGVSQQWGCKVIRLSTCIPSNGKIGRIYGRRFWERFKPYDWQIFNFARSKDLGKIWPRKKNWITQKFI